MSRILGGFIYFVLYLESIIFIKIIIIKEHVICSYFYFLLSFLTYADVYVAMNLHLTNS